MGQQEDLLIKKEKSVSRRNECRHMWQDGVCLKCGKKIEEDSKDD